jgi:precorrin-6B methylase 2
VSTAAERWREDLDAWAIPQALIDAAPESPFGFPAELFRHRAAGAPSSRADSPSTLRALDALPSAGTVMDVGSGGGNMSLPLAGRASHLTAVDGQADMLATFAEAARAAGVEASTILGRWPDVAGDAPTADVVTCGHVAYNVADLGPFVSALHAHAGRRVVMELTDRHPLAWMNDLWFTFHGLTRPDRPKDADAVDVIHDLGFAVEREARSKPHTAADGGFERREDAIALVRRRLCLPANRDDEVAEALGERLLERGGLWSAGPSEQTVVTLWWDRPPRTPPED